MGVYVLIGFILIFSIILLLSFLGPEDRKQGFWYTIQKIRQGMDFVSYWIFNLFAIGAILLVIFYGGRKLLTGS